MSDWPDIDKLWREAGIPQPDHYVDLFAIDMGEAEWPIEPRNAGNRYYKLPGCYAFVNCRYFRDSEPCEVMYVGKAINLKERLRQHWRNNSAFLDKWQGWVEDKPETREFSPLACVWLREEKAGFEVEIQKKCKPRFNQRRE